MNESQLSNGDTLSPAAALAIQSVSDVERKISRKKLLYTSYVIAVLMLAYTFSFIDRQILSLLVEPMKKDLQINDTQMSLLQGLSFAIFYTIMGLPLGRMADSHSRRGLIAWGVGLWSCMTAFCGMVSNYWHLFLARMGVGVGEAALSPAAYSLIADTVDKRHLGTAISIYSMGIYLGAGLALIVGGLVIQWANGVGNIVLPLIGEVFAWQLVFLCVGLPGLLLVPLMFTIKEPPRKRMASQLQLAQQPQQAPLSAVVQYFKNHRKTILCHNLGIAFASLAGYGTLAWAPTFLIRNHDLTGGQTGLYFGIIVLIFGGGGVISGGWMADRWGRKGCQDAKMRVACIGALCGAVPALLYPLMGSLSLVLVLLCMATFFNNFMLGVGPAAIQEVVPSNMRGQFSALYLFIVNLIGLGLGPTAVALCTDYLFADSSRINYSLALVPTTALLCSATLSYLCLRHFRDSVNALQASETTQ